MINIVILFPLIIVTLCFFLTNARQDIVEVEKRMRHEAEQSILKVRAQVIESTQRSFEVAQSANSKLQFI